MKSEKQRMILQTLSIVLVGEILALVGLGLIYFNSEFFGTKVALRRFLVIGCVVVVGVLLFGLAISILIRCLIYKRNKWQFIQNNQRFDLLKREYGHNLDVIKTLEDKILDGAKELSETIRWTKHMQGIFLVATCMFESAHFDSYFYKVDWSLIKEADKEKSIYFDLFDYSHQIQEMCKLISELETLDTQTIEDLLLVVAEKIGTLKRMDPQETQEEHQVEETTTLENDRTFETTKQEKNPERVIGISASDFHFL